MAVAGCGTHRAQVIDRQGLVVTTADTLIEVEWNRVLNDTGTARVLIHPDGDCCEKLGAVRSWRHRLVIWRDQKPVFEGPIIQASWGIGTVELFAGDVLAWLDRRVPHSDMTFTGRDLTEIAEALIDDGFAPDDPGHTVQIVGKSGVTGDRTYETDVEQTGDHLRDLAGTGLDYTAIGSTILLLPDDFAVSIGSLSDVDLPDGLVIAEDGAALATRWVVHGDEETGIKGVAGGVDAYYGLLERAAEETSIKDNASAASAALSRLRTSYPVPIFMDSDQVTLSPDANIDVPLLVPGWCLDITSVLACRNLAQRLKVLGVKVVENGDSEKIQVQLGPTGFGSGV
ncbi:hypothetical protein [Streptomyces sp. H27-H5]|uniref:hypothetical protein n=1 Tax=Streptomyces sp. H27-H5 TaxID=2996460 RepID=UPI002271A563|nr:hypothetical protein [Streptomyces sp. H27-H5]MCY0957752.1 hypothetical protein [Streptomyces sp. H27-H5]